MLQLQSLVAVCQGTAERTISDGRTAANGFARLTAFAPAEPALVRVGLGDGIEQLAERSARVRRDDGCEAHASGVCGTFSPTGGVAVLRPRAVAGSQKSPSRPALAGTAFGDLGRACTPGWRGITVCECVHRERCNVHRSQNHLRREAVALRARTHGSPGLPRAKRSARCARSIPAPPSARCARARLRKNASVGKRSQHVRKRNIPSRTAKACSCAHPWQTG